MIYFSISYGQSKLLVIKECLLNSIIMDISDNSRCCPDISREVVWIKSEKADHDSLDGNSDYEISEDLWEESEEPVNNSHHPCLLICYYCRKLLSKRVLLRRHLQSHAKEFGTKVRMAKLNYQCSKCRNMTRISLPIRHKKPVVHEGCAFCQKITKHRVVFEMAPEIFQCRNCSYKTVYSCSYREHMNTHNKTKKYHCHECSYTSDFPNAIQRHILNIHIGLKAFSCDQCDYRCVQKSSLTYHMASRHSKSHPFVCPHCTYSTVRVSNFRMHLEGRHGEKKSLKHLCPHCEYATSVYSALKRHLSARHHYEKTFCCKMCDYRAGDSSALRLHVMSKHTMVKPFYCKDCGYRCAKSGNLKNHMRTMHTGFISFSCPDCDFECIEGKDMGKHYFRTHPPPDKLYPDKLDST